MRATLLGACSAIVVLAACGSETPAALPDPPDPTGSLRLALTTTGPGTVPQLRIRLDDRPDTTVAANSIVVLEDLFVGEHTIQVDVPGQCTSSRFAPQSATIVEGERLDVAWTVRCPAPVNPGLYFIHRPASSSSQVAMRADPDGSHVVPAGIPGWQDRPVMNPARTRIAWIKVDNGDGQWRLWISDPDGQNAVHTGLYADSYAWSPDGRQLVIAHGRILSINWPDGTQVRKLRNGSIPDVDWAPDGRHIAYIEGAYHYVYDLETDTRVNTLVLNGSGVAWSPDGARLAFVELGTQTLWTMRSDGSDRRAIHQGNMEPFIDWRSDGAILFSKLLPVVGGGARYSIFHVPGTGGTAVEAFQSLDGGDNRQPRWAP